MRIDSHNHYWHYNRLEQDWMQDSMEVLFRDYMPPEHLDLLQSIGFDGTIVIEARQMLMETQWLLQLADQHDHIKGVVGWVDLRSHQLYQQLESFANHPKLCGMRHVVIDESEVDFYLKPEFLRGIETLGEFNLTYDLLNSPQQLPSAIKLVEKFPDQPFVLDHISNPLIKEKMVSPWKEDLIELAKNENVFCKLSGMVEFAEWNNWQADQFKFYLDTATDAFGLDRLMIGSNWPVCLLSGPFKPVMDIAINYTNQFSEQTKENILGNTCARFYGIH